MNPTNLYAQGSEEIKTEITYFDEVILKLGQKAPNPGILVPEDNYRFYQSQVMQNAILDRNLLKCTEEKTPTFTDYILPVLAGVLIGGISVLAIQR